MRYAIIGVAAALSSLVYYSLFFHSPIGGGGEMVTIARNLAERGTFSDPFSAGRTGPTALAPPVYPAILAALLKAFGPDGGVRAALLLTAIALGFHAVLLVHTSGLFFKDRKPGLYAAALSIALPAIRLNPWWDALYTADGLMGFCLLSAWAERRVRSAFRRGAIVGAAVGGLALLNPSSLFVSVTWVLFSIGRKWRAETVRYCSAAALLCLLTCLPWALRNYRLLGAPVLKDNFGLSLHTSNNDCASPSLLEGIRSGCNAIYNPDMSPAELALVQDMGEVRYDAYRRSTATEWIRRHVVTFATLTAKRMLQFWFPVSDGGAYAYTVWLITAMSVAGIILIRSDGVSIAFLIAGPIFYSALYYLNSSDIRYRYPIFWLSLICAGYCLERFEKRLKYPRQS